MGLTVTCLFCRIARGEVDAHTVYADDEIVAFLDIGPIRPGHVQIIPRTHIETFEQLPEPTAARILALGQRIARAHKEVYGVDRVGFLFTGGDIPHAHAHVVPLHERTDITSRRYICDDDLMFASLPRPPDAELRATANALRVRLGASDPEPGDETV